MDGKTDKKIIIFMIKVFWTNQSKEDLKMQIFQFIEYF